MSIQRTSSLLLDLPVESICTAYREGAPATALAERYNVSYQIIYRVLHRARVPVREPSFSRKQRAIDGHRVSGGWLRLVDDWLSDHGVPHDVHVPLPFGRGFYAAFRARDSFIEVFGVSQPPVDEATAEARARCKLELYSLFGLPVIELWARDLGRRDFSRLHMLL